MRGRFDRELTRPQLILYTTNYFNTIRFLMLGIFGVVIGALPLIPMNPNPELTDAAPVTMTLMDKIAGFCFSLASIASLASVIYSRHVWVTYRLPAKKWFMQDVSVSRADSPRVYRDQQTAVKQ